MMREMMLVIDMMTLRIKKKMRQKLK